MFILTNHADPCQISLDAGVWEDTKKRGFRETEELRTCLREQNSNCVFIGSCREILISSISSVRRGFFTLFIEKTPSLTERKTYDIGMWARRLLGDKTRIRFNDKKPYVALFFSKEGIVPIDISFITLMLRAGVVPNEKGVDENAVAWLNSYDVRDKIAIGYGFNSIMIYLLLRLQELSRGKESVFFNATSNNYGIYGNGPQTAVSSIKPFIDHNMRVRLQKLKQNLIEDIEHITKGITLTPVEKLDALIGEGY